MIRKHIVFCGRVQGVGFRYRARFAADHTGCTGWVRNEYDGSVTMEIQGTEEQIDLVLQEIRQWKYVQIERMDVKQIAVDPKEKRFRAGYM
ncbi:MAG: acylphosphatase [Eubacterium sp.]|nr:acylphosphatase [Eubacterium sp.]